MPTYNYKCTECDHTFEKRQKISDEPIKECPECKAKVEKVLYAPQFQLKGAGWTGRIG